MSYDLPVRRSQAAGSAFTVATLPTLSQMVGEPIGMLAYTVDGGLYAWNGTTWVAVAANAALALGITPINGGTSGYVLYDNAGVVGELANTGTGNNVLATSPTLVTPVLGAATGTSFALNGATIGSNALAVTGSTLLTEAVGSSALTLTGATQTTAVPVLNATQTWNNAATTFTGVKLNVTDTTSAAASLLMDMQLAGASKFKVAKDGTITAANSFITTSGSFTIFSPTSGLALRNGGTTIFSPADNTIRLGNNDSAAPNAQTLAVSSVVTGTTNTVGQNFTITGSRGTGTGIGGDIIFQVAPAGTTGTAQNALAQALRIYNDKTVFAGAGFTVATLPTAGTVGRRAYVTDATAPTFGGALVGGGAVVIPVFDNGAAWVSA